MPQSAGLHERDDLLDDATKDRHRALASLGEELEAVDWYDQRIAATTDADLKAILAHNRDEEKEHASMVLEWLRRHDAAFDGALRQYLFIDGSIVGHEAAVEAAGGTQGTPAGGGANGGARGIGGPSLGIGSLKGRGGL
jgi:ferritin-like protein